MLCSFVWFLVFFLSFELYECDCVSVCVCACEWIRMNLCMLTLLGVHNIYVSNVRCQYVRKLLTRPANAVPEGGWVG